MYTVCNIKCADAIGWAIFDKDSDLFMYPFKFPELSSDEIRIKILYSSLC